jgi:diguanylate cyclase (GGDEF)-like protein
MSAPPDLDPTADVQRRLAAMAAVATAVAGADELEEVLEVAAEQIRGALRVSSVSISRWHLAERLLQTLINVGELGPGEERWPVYETYDIAQFPLAHRVLREGRPHVTSLHAPNADAAERDLLIKLGKEWCAAFPIVYDGATWGEIYVTNAPGKPPLDAGELTFLADVCAQVSQAIGRAERFSQLLEVAYRDALTGIANRRAFDERLQEALAGDGPVGLLLGDVDGLKAVNDTHGHAAGDAALRQVGAALTEACGPGQSPARIGGDEFAVIVEGGSEDGDRALIAAIAAALRDAGVTVSLSWGATRGVSPHPEATELIRAADVAQYAEKRRHGAAAAPPARGDDRRASRTPSQADDDAAVLALITAGLALLDGLADRPAAERRAALDALIARTDWTARAAPALELLRREAARPGRPQ